MKKSIIILLILLTSICYADEIATYNGFPLYPPEKINEFQNQNAEKISVKLFPLESLNIVFKDREEGSKKFSALMNVNRDKINNAAKYIKETAVLLGWKFIGQGDYWDGGSFDYLFYKKNEKYPYVKVSFSRGLIVLNNAKVVYPEDYGNITYNFGKDFLGSIK